MVRGHECIGGTMLRTTLSTRRGHGPGHRSVRSRVSTTAAPSPARCGEPSHGVVGSRLEAALLLDLSPLGFDPECRLRSSFSSETRNRGLQHRNLHSRSLPSKPLLRESVGDALGP